MNSFIGPPMNFISVSGEIKTIPSPSLVSKGRWKVERTPLTAEERTRPLTDKEFGDLLKAAFRGPSHVIAEPPDGWCVTEIRQRRYWGDMHPNVYFGHCCECAIDPERGRLLTVCLEDWDGDSEVMHQVWKGDEGWIEIPPGQREHAPLPRPNDEPSIRVDTQHEDGEGL